MHASIRALSPSNTASTVPSRRFRANPRKPSSSAFSWQWERKYTPCTRPWNTTRALAIIAGESDAINVQIVFGPCGTSPKRVLSHAAVEAPGPPGPGRDVLGPRDGLAGRHPGRRPGQDEDARGPRGSRRPREGRGGARDDDGNHPAEGPSALDPRVDRDAARPGGEPGGRPPHGRGADAPGRPPRAPRVRAEEAPRDRVPHGPRAGDREPRGVRRRPGPRRDDPDSADDFGGRHHRARGPDDAGPRGAVRARRGRGTPPRRRRRPPGHRGPV